MHVCFPQQVMSQVMIPGIPDMEYIQLFWSIVFNRRICSVYLPSCLHWRFQIHSHLVCQVFGSFKKISCIFYQSYLGLYRLQPSDLWLQTELQAKSSWTACNSCVNFDKHVIVIISLYGMVIISLSLASQTAATRQIYCVIIPGGAKVFRGYLRNDNILCIFLIWFRVFTSLQLKI